nr:uridine diphosphate-glycosyltransferases 40AX1 [Glyphodes pyloalis]
MELRLFYKFLCLFSIFSCIDAYKVLVSFSLPVRSLNLLGEGVVRHFLNAGHEVTYITAFPFKDPPKKNFRQVDASSTRKLFENFDLLNTANIMQNDIQNSVYQVQTLGLEGAKAAFEDKNIRKLLEDPNETFDVVIADLMESELYTGLAAVFNCPMVWLYSMGAHSMALRLVDQPANPAYAADYLTGNVHPFSFAQRVDQIWMHIQWYFLKWAVTMPKEEAVYNEFFGPLVAKRGRALPNYRELVYNASLMLSNEHYAMGNIPATPQNFKFIGGFHIEEPVKPLPKNLQTIMDNAKDGVIYFSMGSTWKSKDIPPPVTQELLRMFGELKQTVIWKYEEELKNTPPNLHVVQWAPQNSILAHPNLLFFITHGGLLSSTEALHFGVPVLGVPVFFDQFINVNKAILKGYAQMAKLDIHLADNLRPVIQEMLRNPKYKEKALELSRIYHDRPVSPGQEMVHWVEHVVRTGGAPHLRSPALHMPVYQKIYLDFAIAILVIVVVLMKAAKLIFGKKEKKEIKKTKKN